MKTFALSLFSVLALTALSFAEESASPWMTDYQAALAKAKESGKPVFADFTGSDWCPWCIKLDKETYTQPAFLTFAKDNVVLLELDYPRTKKLSEDLTAQNQKLSKEFKIEGFPTQVLIDGEGKEIARNVGYMAGGPDAMIKWIKDSTKK